MLLQRPAQMLHTTSPPVSRRGSVETVGKKHFKNHIDYIEIGSSRRLLHAVE
jgi:hypothetical protein